MFRVFHLHPGHQPLVHPFSLWRSLCNPEDSVTSFTANPRTPPRFSKGKQSSPSEAAWALVPRELEESGRGRGKSTETLGQEVSHFSFLGAAAVTRNKVVSQQVVRMKWGRSWERLEHSKCSQRPLLSHPQKVGNVGSCFSIRKIDLKAWGGEGRVLEVCILAGHDAAHL